jgi:MFS superfamily sulfate permease-like transporter
VPTLFIALAVLAIIVGFEVFARRFPGGLVAVIGMTAANAFFHWGNHGVHVVGEVPSGLPLLNA